MSRICLWGSVCVTALMAGGCASNGEKPLVFASSNVFGLSLGGSVSDAGGEFVVGYKGANFAVIPVSGVQPSGAEELVGANYGQTHMDSYSVIGQFNATAKQAKTGANAGLGKFFATGTASQNIAYGFARKMGLDRTTTVACGAKPASVAAADEFSRKLDQVMAALMDQNEAHRRLEARLANAGASATAAAPKQASTAAAASGRSGASLVFAQYDYKALAIDGSAIEQGLKLTLGFKGKNIAVVPVLGRDANGNLIHLEAKDPGSGQDAYSVLGQFESSDDVAIDAADKSRTTTSSLGSFFSTGAASRTLSAGFKVKLCDEYVAPTKVAGTE